MTKPKPKLFIEPGIYSDEYKVICDDIIYGYLVRHNVNEYLGIKSDITTRTEISITLKRPKNNDQK